MGHLLFAELGGVAGSSIFDNTDPNLARFTNIQSSSCWSCTVANIYKLVGL